MKRRIILASGAGAVLGLLLGRSPGALAGNGPRVLIFVPSDEKPRSIEGKLNSSMGSLDITVFGKAKDLERSVASQNHDAVIAPVPTLKALGKSITLNGKRGGSKKNPNVLVTADKGVAPKSMASGTVGMFGIMGRNEMKTFCGKLLGTGSQKIKTVTKYADLLPLLQFKAAEGVVLPKREVQELISRSALKLVVTDLPGGQVGLTGVAVTNSSAKGPVLSAVNGLSSAAKASLGIEGWQ